MTEPKRLFRGKEFHKAVQSEWKKEAAGDIAAEKSTIKLNGRRGRIDIYVSDENKPVAVVEIKCSDWDSMTPRAVKRNVKRYSRQIFDYVDAEMGQDTIISISIIFSQRPESTERRDLVEDLFWNEGVPVVWQDESIEECRERSLEKGRYS